MEPVTLVVTGRSMHQSALLYRPKGRKRRGYQVPRSAPPQLNRRRSARVMSSSSSSTRSMRVQSAHFSQEPARLSVNDVYNIAERTRVRSSQESRQQMLAEIQKMVRNDSAASRPISDLGRAITSAYMRELTPSNYNTHQELEEDTESSPLGFVSNVEISIKPNSRRHSAETQVTVDRSAGSARRRHSEDHSGKSQRLNSAESRATSGYRLNSAETQKMNSQRLSSADAKSQRLTSAGTQKLSSYRINSGDVSSVSGLRLNSAEVRASSGYSSHVHTAATPTTGRSHTDGEIVLACTPRPGTIESAEEARRLNVSRQCCEVMGPGVCRECRKLRVRMMERARMEADFPRLRVSEKNVTTSAMVKRMFPELTQAEIQDKIARGEIARTGLIFPNRHLGHDGFSDEDDDEREHDSYRLRHIHSDDDDASDDDRRGSGGHPENGLNGHTSGSLTSLGLIAKLKLKLRGEASTPLFFTDLRHMNSKIYSGRLTKNLRPPKSREMKDEDLLSVHGGQIPAFVSPRKGKLMEEPSYKVYFDPPLLAKHQQVSNPSFFAGSDEPYSLPERLPDVIEFADGKTSITDPSALRSESSMSFVSGVSDEGVEQTGVADRIQETVPE